MNDLKFALRQLLRNPGFTAVAVLTLGLGIGLVSAQFTLIDGVLLRPLPFPDSERLFHIGRQNEGSDGHSWRPITMAEFLAHREQQTHFDEIAAFQEGTFNLSRTGGPPRRLGGTAVTANFFRLLRMAPQAGRVFQPGEDQPGQPLLAILSDAVWREEFGGEAAVVGQAVRLNGEPATVIGVMPPGFRFPNREDCWINLRLRPEAVPGQEPQRVAAMGLLKPDASVRAAKAGLDLIRQRHQETFETGHARPEGMDVRPFPAAYTNGGTVTLLYTMLAMTGFVLALACVNVANLHFVRATGRLRELAVRAALGAGRGRIFRQLLLESVVLAGAGAVLGVLLAGVCARLLETQVTTRMDVSSWLRFDLNARVLAFTVMVASLAGICAGFLPALRSSKVNLSDALKDGARGSTGHRGGWLSRWLVAAQMTFAGGLVVVALLLALSALRSSRVNLAFAPDSLLLGRLELLGPAYDDREARVRFYNQLIDRVRAVPGVAAAAVSSRDLVNQAVYSPFELEGVAYSTPRDRPGGWVEVVSRDYFQIVNHGTLRGRLFGRADTADSQPVALVNRSFSEKHWPGADPVGRRIRRAEKDAPWATIVGVVPDLNMEGVGNNDPAAGWYLLQDQQAWGWLDLLVRAQADPAAVIPGVRAAVAALDPEQPIHTLGTLQVRTSRRVAGLQIVGFMAGTFALTSLLLAGIGIYGVLAFTVKRRTPEFGVRLALGSSGRGILALLLRQNAPRALAGVGGGLALGYALAMPLAPLLPKVSVTDFRVYAAVAVLLGSVSALAVWVPACRASRIEPMEVLRSE